MLSHTWREGYERDVETEKETCTVFCNQVDYLLFAYICGSGFCENYSAYRKGEINAGYVCSDDAVLLDTII